MNNFPRQDLPLGRPRTQPLEGKAGREVGFRSPSAWMAATGPPNPVNTAHVTHTCPTTYRHTSTFS